MLPCAHPVLNLTLFVFEHLADLALRLARNHTGGKDVYHVDGAYHGNTSGTLAISSYGKYAAREGADAQHSVQMMSPDPYRLGMSEAQVVEMAEAEFVAQLDARPEGPAAYIVESMICCGGQVLFIARGDAPIAALPSWPGTESRRTRSSCLRAT